MWYLTWQSLKSPNFETILVTKKPSIIKIFKMHPFNNIIIIITILTFKSKAESQEA